MDLLRKNASVFIITRFFASFVGQLVPALFHASIDHQSASIMTTDETTPLLPKKESAKSRLGSWLKGAFKVENRILLAGFLITLSFSFTQVP